MSDYKYVYGLFYIDPVDKEKYCFYVGRTDNIKQRMSGHRTEIKNEDWDKSIFVRDVLESQGIDWFEEVLEQSRKGKFNVNWERWWIIKMIRDNQPIQNMKHGDLDSIEEVAKIKSIQSVEDVAREYKKRERSEETFRDKVLKEYGDILDHTLFLTHIRMQVRKTHEALEIQPVDSDNPGRNDGLPLVARMKSRDKITTIKNKLLKLQSATYAVVNVDETVVDLVRDHLGIILMDLTTLTETAITLCRVKLDRNYKKPRNVKEYSDKLQQLIDDTTIKSKHDARDS